MENENNVCHCNALSQKVAQHEEMIAQLVYIVAVLNRTVARMNSAESI